MWISADGRETLMNEMTFSSVGWSSWDYRREGDLQRRLIAIYDQPIPPGIAHPGGPTTYYAQIYHDGIADDWFVGKSTHPAGGTVPLFCGQHVERMRLPAYASEVELDGRTVRKYEAAIDLGGRLPRDITLWVAEDGTLLRMETFEFDGMLVRFDYSGHGEKNIIEPPEGVTPPPEN